MIGPDERHDRDGDDGPIDAQIRTFLIADVRGYTLSTQVRGDDAAGSLVATFAGIVCDGLERLDRLRG